VPDWLWSRLMGRAFAVPDLRRVHLDALVEAAEIARAESWLEQEFGQDVRYLIEFARAPSGFVIADLARSR
jgi:hypothetical protein